MVTVAISDVVHIVCGLTEHSKHSAKLIGFNTKYSQVFGYYLLSTKISDFSKIIGFSVFQKMY